ncbi:MAG: hypothetical protein LUE92_04315 [Clostridiales bacterium]|nr:hypothetical protein [Clostridiales bacterium]
MSKNETDTIKEANRKARPKFILLAVYTFVADHTRRASLAECFAAEG